MAQGANGVNADDDLQAVDGIPRDTLVALLRRKDREAKALTAKLEKLEERYVKVVRINKILMEDRAGFMRFSVELLPDSGDIFEEAAAQEIPVNLEALLRRLMKWRNTLEGVKEDRKVFQQFTELAFPGDEAVRQLFESHSLSADAFDVLQQRWVAQEELHSQSIASISAMARDQVATKGTELQEALTAKEESERRIADLKAELTKMAKEKGQMLARRLQGSGGEVEGSEEPARDTRADEAELQAAVEARSMAEKRAKEALDSAKLAEERERDTRSQLEVVEAKARQMREELEKQREEIGRSRDQARQLVADKDDVLSRLRERMSQLEDELGSNSFIERAADLQAGRDAEVRAQQREKQQILASLTEIQRLLSLSYSQEKVLKERIRELESTRDRGAVAGDYLKHVVVKYVEYTQRGDMKAQSLIPVLNRLLSLSPEERKTIEKPAIPQPLAYLNQAVGESIVWLRGDGSEAPPPRGAVTDAIHPAFQEESEQMPG